MKQKIAIVLLLIFYGVNVFSQLKDVYQRSAPRQTVFAIKADYGTVVIHTKAIEAMRGARPTGFGFEISKQAKDSATYQLCSSYPRVGLQFQYFNYGTPILGNSGKISYFIQPVYRINNYLHFFFRASIGLSYSDNPFNPNSPIDTLNQSYSIRFNPYLQVSSGWGLRLSSKLSMEVNSAFNHISNGNINRPNRGLNWLTGSIALLYTPNGSSLPRYHRIKNKFWKGLPIDYRLGMLYVGKQDYAGHTMGYARTFAAGGFIEASKQIGGIHAIVAGIQVYHNNLQVDPPAEDVPNWKNKHTSVLAGLYVGHEFLLGKVIISQVVGRYISQHPVFYNNYFHQHSFRYVLNRHWQPGFAFRAHADEADFISINLLYKY